MNTLQPDQLHFVQEDEFLPSISPWISMGGMVLVLVFGAAVAISSTLKFSITVKAPAAIRPAGGLSIVQSGIDGTITHINVEENQVVKKGDLFAQLDDSGLQTRKSQLQGDIQSITLQRYQINAQLRALDHQIIAETRLVSRSIAAAEANLTSHRRRYQDLKISTEADLEEAQAGYHLASEEYLRFKELEESGAIAKLQVKEKEASLKAASARIKRLKAATNPSDATIDQALEQIAQEKARGSVTLAGLNQQKEQLMRTRIEAQKQLQRTQKELQQIDNELKGTKIRAPIDGTVLQLNLRNPGQVVQPGIPIAQIAPRNAPLIIKARVNAQDINQVKTGQMVQMRVSACPYTDYGTLQGTVMNVSPDAIPVNDASGPATSPAFYEVTVQPRTLYMGNQQRWCRLQFGMEGRADIVSRQETVLQFVLKKARLMSNF
ncbi:HlyD family secretion protein [Acaryochloris marina]|uniref:HlyD family secretion protein n=1 Tax=Acaryochloris marina (strain MBIC 11017) TaxID=329726 RepID=B0CC94_ACAM1|nr:HlyD family efflux transporter periplasmic adaptor subunit [Acaryochloris marina]ABW26779.1 HlyD family secretion protein [Acaryochloris marina MBIC11017]BDM81556.1 HlyD family type I secretion periplasmic adaptor subunit [Acaryochloris marina MBIC10699]